MSASEHDSTAAADSSAEPEPADIMALTHAFYAGTRTVRGPFGERFEAITPTEHIDARITGQLWADRRGALRFDFDDADGTDNIDLGPSISAEGITLYAAPSGHYCRRHDWTSLFGVMVDESRSLEGYVASAGCGLAEIDGALCFAPPHAQDPARPGFRYWARTGGPFAGAIVQIVVVQGAGYRRTYTFDPARMEYDVPVDGALDFVPEAGSIERDVRGIPCGPLPTEGPLPFVAAVRARG